MNSEEKSSFKGKLYQYTWSPVNVMITAWVLIFYGEGGGNFFIQRNSIVVDFFPPSFLLPSSSSSRHSSLLLSFVQVFIHLIPSIFQPVAGGWNARNVPTRAPPAPHDYDGLTIDSYGFKEEEEIILCSVAYSSEGQLAGTD